MFQQQNKNVKNKTKLTKKRINSELLLRVTTGPERTLNFPLNVMSLDL